MGNTVAGIKEQHRQQQYQRNQQQHSKSFVKISDRPMAYTWLFCEAEYVIFFFFK
jgi:hypothetical protein